MVVFLSRSNLLKKINVCFSNKINVAQTPESSELCQFRDFFPSGSLQKKVSNLKSLAEKGILVPTELRFHGLPSRNFTSLMTNVPDVMCLLRPKHMNSSRGCPYVTKRFYHENPNHATLRDNVVKVLPLMRELVISGAAWIITNLSYLVGVLFWRLERIPYTRRLHVVLSYELIERKLGESNRESFKNDEDYKGKLLDRSAPLSIRAESVAGKIIQAMNSSLKLGGDFKINGLVYDGKPQRPSLATDENVVSEIDSVRPRMVRKHSWKLATKHLDGSDWRVHVVDSTDGCAEVQLGNLILIYTGQVDCLWSDAEMATVIAHEIAHAVARHTAEDLAKIVWWKVAYLGIILHFIADPSLFTPILELTLLKYIQSCFYRRNEIEADKIGLILMALAGYNPRVAPKVYSKLIGGSGGLFSSHPAGHVRAWLLRGSLAMEEAVAIYKEVKANKVVRSFV